ncbi:MAG: 1,4-dihydroxy-2-naphthoate octaprenyltransferase [Bdellovibrionota bacterium]|nr:1,4-dihydroxy-2-naphthoate octaprenyltransferase [Bdellovibrionota bacterium]
MTQTSAWFLATRPKTLFASMGPVFLGLFLCLHTGKDLSPIIAFLTISSALLMQIGTNLVNDYFDFKTGVDSNNRLGPKRVTSEGLLSPKQVQTGYQLCFFLAFLFGVYLMYTGGTPIIIIGLLSLLTAYIYTGGPFPLSHHGLGEITALIFFGPLAVWGTFFLQTNKLDIFPLLVGMGPGLIAAALMSINNLRDIVSDKKAGKKTLAVLLGEKRARLFSILLILFSSVIPLLCYVLNPRPLLILSALSPYLFWKWWQRLRVGPIDEGLNLVLAKTGQYLFLYSLLFGIGLL